MITNEVKFIFKKRENVKHALEKRKESAHQGMNIMTWPGAIRHSKSADRHFQSVEWHSSHAKWHAAPPSYTYATPCNFALSDIFF